MTEENKIAQVIELLVNLLGRERVVSDHASMVIYSREIFMPGSIGLSQGKIQNLASALCYPESVDEVSKIISRARANRIPVIVFVAGSGVLVGTAPSHNGIIIDLKRMKKIRAINRTNHTVEVESGVMCEDLERALNQEGFSLGHFPGSFYHSTVGAWLSTSSAGQISAKYGRIKDMVISLEGTLADGSIFRTRRTPRSATGPDIDQILLGSDATLAIITSAVLNIFPLPEKKNYRGFGFADVKSGLDAMRELMQKELTPAVLTLFDPAGTKFNQEKLSGPSSGCLLVVGYEAANSELSELRARLGFERLKQMGGTDLGEEPGLKWLEHRYSLPFNQSKAVSQSDTLVDTIEVSVIWKDSFALYEKVVNEISKFGIAMAHFSHACREGVYIYFSFAVSDSDPEKLKEKQQKVWESTMESCLTIGASVSNYPGISLRRAQWLKQELGVGHELLQKLKKEIDPDNILNPGKLELSQEGAPARPSKMEKKE